MTVAPPPEASRDERNVVLTSPLLRDAGFRHGFSTRAGASDVAVLALAIGVDGASTYQVNQVHGARVLVAGGDVSAMRGDEADALVAWRGEAPVARATTVGIRVADCVPVLVGDPASGAVAAIHAGWRGLVAGVIGASVAALDGAPGSSRDRVAAIGPCIGACCFEVGAEVADAIARACAGHDASARVVARRAGDKAFVDLRLAARLRLRAAGLDDARIDDVAGCTRCDADRFFSYRREGAAAGRHLALIETASPRRDQSSSSSSSSSSYST